MQVRKLTIEDHKCLVDFSIRFETVDGGSSTILIGENGTGKTTMLETILEILLSFDSDAIEKKIDYKYEFEYLYAGSIINICQSDKNYQITIDEEVFCEGKMGIVRNRLMNKNKSIFPERIMSFYSGANNKFLPQIRRINNTYLRRCRQAIRHYQNEVAHGEGDFNDIFPKRKYNYCEEQLTPIYLCAIIGGNDSFEKRYLQETSHFGSIQNVYISIDVGKVTEFYGGRILHDEPTEYLYDLIDFIDNRFTDLFRQKFLYVSDGTAYYELDDIAHLQLDSISLFEFFEKLQSLFDAEYEVYISYGKSRIKCSDLSEGQRQLIKILGMLGTCKSEDCLVLMDEPDAHMNPRWKYDLKHTIDESLREATNTQAIIATHDPLVINGVDKQFIRIFANNQSLIANNNLFFTKIIEPTEETKGMGIDGLLQSEYYGLRTSYDKASTDKFTRRQELYSKLINNEIDAAGKEELRTLTREIGSLPMSENSIDFLYDDFIREYRNTNLFSKEYLSYEDIQKRREKIREIIAKLFEGQA